MLSYFSGIWCGHRDCEWLGSMAIPTGNINIVFSVISSRANCPGMPGGRKSRKPAWRFEEDISSYKGRRPWYVKNQNPTRYLLFWIPVGSLVTQDNHLVLGRFWPSKWLPKWDCRYTHMMLFVLFIWSYSDITAHHFLCFEIFSGIMMYIMPFCLVCMVQLSKIWIESNF